jgi:hypothetical protein
MRQHPRPGVLHHLVGVNSRQVYRSLQTAAVSMAVTV